MSEPVDVIAVGETMLSLVATDGPLATAGTFHATHGGAESNALVGLTRRGLRTAWVGRLGTDSVGDRVYRWLEDEGLDLRWAIRDPERFTGVMIRDTQGCVEYRRTGSAASITSPGDLEAVPVADARAVLVTGITALIGVDPQHAALALLERAGGLRAVDTNLRPGLWGSARGRELIRPLLARCDLLLGGEQELRQLVGGSHGEELAQRCREIGPSEVVIKRGREGAGVLDRDGRWHEHAPVPSPDVDPIGAGDAFNAGYLAARLADAPEPDALAEGARCGAAVAGVLGDTEGFPR